ncbi:MAG TPA: hypothetical protein VK919_09105 [Solirubrobacterales bacterium]|nr:hypothetical protein [Solirubrobacterales bacterium]
MRRTTLGVAISLASCLLLGATTATAATRFAEPTGSGPEPCVTNDPCPLPLAVDGPGVSDSDIVVIRSGSYTLSAPLAINHAITVRSPTLQAATISYTTTGLFQDAVSVNNGGAVLQGVAIFATGPGGALRVSTGRAEWVVARSSGSRGTCLPGVGTAPRLRDSVCHATGSNGIAVDITAGCPGGAQPQDTSLLRNVTAVATGLNGVGMSMDLSSGCNIAYDALNVIAQGIAADLRAVTDADPDTQATITMANSSFDTVSEQGPGASITAPGTGANITEAPAFVAPGDFHQARGSPTIDAGAVDGHTGLADIDGQAREQGEGIDIGADETLVPDTVLIKRPPKRQTTKRKRVNARFKFTSNAFTGDTPTFECKLDKRAYKPCKSPRDYRVKSGGGKGKRHVFRVRATMVGGTDATPAKWRWRVKRTR